MVIVLHPHPNQATIDGLSFEHAIERIRRCGAVCSSHETLHD